MVNIDEQIEQKLNQQIEKLKGELIIFDTIEELTNKLEKLEKEIEQLKTKNKCSNNGSVCLGTVVASHCFNNE